MWRCVAVCVRQHPHMLLLGTSAVGLQPRNSRLWEVAAQHGGAFLWCVPSILQEPSFLGYGRGVEAPSFNRGGEPKLPMTSALISSELWKRNSSCCVLSQRWAKMTVGYWRFFYQRFPLFFFFFLLVSMAVCSSQAGCWFSCDKSRQELKFSHKPLLSLRGIRR